MRSISVTWEGFRGFKKPTTFEFPRITLLIGRNNVGKTSAYAPLLLLKQTLDARNPSTALLSRGELLDAGPFEDYISDHDVARAMNFRLRLPDDGSLGSPPDSDDPSFGSMEFGFRSGVDHEVFLGRHRIMDAEGKALVSRSRDASDEAFSLTSKLLPDRQAVGRPPSELTELRRNLREEQPEGFLFRGYGGLIIPRSIREDRERWAKVQDWYNASLDLYGLHHRSNEIVKSYLRGISYVGPLRSLPQRTYRMGAEAPLDVGRSGEHAPEVLFRQRETDVRGEVERWLLELGYGHLEFKELNDEYYQVHFRTESGGVVNFAHSGVGLSQLMPLLVQGAMAADNATLIAQQPEIHLNPAQQGTAADFLISRAQNGARVIIETHSEHVLLRLRRRIAEGNLMSDDVAIYYLDNVDGSTIARRVELGSQGEIERNDWPRGFFEEQLEDSFALAVAQSIRRQEE